MILPIVDHNFNLRRERVTLYSWKVIFPFIFFFKNLKIDIKILVPVINIPTNLLDTLKLIFISYSSYALYFPYITSSEAEYSFSSLQLTVNHLHSTMDEERLATLTLMNLHHKINIPNTSCQ